MTSLAPSTHWEFNVSILKLNVKMAPEMSGFFNWLPLQSLKSLITRKQLSSQKEGARTTFGLKNLNMVSYYWESSPNPVALFISIKISLKQTNHFQEKPKIAKNKFSIFCSQNFQQYLENDHNVWPTDSNYNRDVPLCGSQAKFDARMNKQPKP